VWGEESSCESDRSFRPSKEVEKEWWSCASTPRKQATPLQAWTGPEGSRRLRLPDFKKSAHEGGKVVSPKHRPHVLYKKVKVKQSV
jgi:hypothetical protein